MLACTRVFSFEKLFNLITYCAAHYPGKWRPTGAREDNAHLQLREAVVDYQQSAESFVCLFQQ